MEKIKVKICQGTTCFVMGGEVIKSIHDTLVEKYADKIEIVPVRCLEVCHDADSFSQAPYVYVNDEVVSAATVDKVISVIESKLKNE
ncbi:MAG: NAD(P)H-dependent oxidoreductase subunit E [Alphaproteobacteria bacterium]|nr:NAD(P)H-dependent oxidoreductase subunit E [Alphaproteobacteria bacterium]